MGCDGVMVTLEESFPHMHLKKRGKKSMFPFSRGHCDRFFLS